MKQLEPSEIQSRLTEWVGQDVYIHLEVNPGAYWRNGQARLHQAHVKGRGPYRLSLELDAGQGLIHVDDLTHASVDEDMVICIAFDDKNRLSRTIEVSRLPFQ